MAGRRQCRAVYYITDITTRGKDAMFNDNLAETQTAMGGCFDNLYSDPVTFVVLPGQIHGATTLSRRPKISCFT
jgi:hypothetical protein